MGSTLSWNSQIQPLAPSFGVAGLGTLGLRAKLTCACAIICLISVMTASAVGESVDVALHTFARRRVRQRNHKETVVRRVRGAALTTYFVVRFCTAVIMSVAITYLQPAV